MKQADTTIIFTNSYDVTVDLLLRYLPSHDDRIVRFNFDLFAEYDVVYSGEELRITDPVGRTVNQHDICKAYYRKPMTRTDLASVEHFVEGEHWVAFRSMLYWLWEMEKLVLVEPFTEKARINKFRQLRLAQEFFPVPPAMFATHLDRHYPPWEQTVVKSLSGGQLGDRTLFTTLVEPQQLDPTYPWFLQEYVEAVFDITVVFVRGQVFSFRLPRDFIAETVDFRAPAEGTWHAWEHIEMPEAFNQSVAALMERLRLDYGRLDFLMQADGSIYFCEVNPNGQFAWLDLENQAGLLSAIAYEIAPSTPVHPVPFSPF